jgi:type VI secretion system protein ImpL
MTRHVVAGEAGAIRPTAETSALHGKLMVALQTLDDPDHGWRQVNARPWYAIIGPPGAGKTTAIMNAGLRFLAGRAGAATLRGVGGTQGCEWLLAEEAVLIDTAGAYTTHDPEASKDRAGWLGLLALLKQIRPSRPLNGIIAAVELGDIAAASENCAAAHAAAIRQRIAELQTHFGLSMPLYLMLTKTDMVAGFEDFFADLGQDKRSHAWGITLDPDANAAAGISRFGARFRVLTARLETQLFERLQAERSVERRVALAMFPGNIAQLEQRLTRYLQALTSGGALFLRGVYFTSAVSKDIPGAVAAAAGIPGLAAHRGDMSSARPEGSYFIAGFFRDVVFRDSRVMLKPPGQAQRGLVLRAAVLAVSVAGVGLASVHLWHVRSKGLQAAETARRSVQAYERIAATLPAGQAAAAQLQGIVPVLDAAEAPPGRELMIPGLATQSHTLNTALHVMYRHALERTLLPRLLWRLESQMRDNENRPDVLYETIRIYLILAGAGPLDKTAVHEWMRQDWQTLYPGDGRLRTSLLHHLDSLLAERLPALQPDGELVAHVRAVLAKISAAQLAYVRISRSAAAQLVPPWRPSDALGPAGIALFSRGSGKPLTEGVPGFYTAAGFQTVLLPSLGKAAGMVAAESWVMGEHAAGPMTAAQTRSLERDILHLYERDYAHVWDAMIADLDVVQLRSVPQAAQDLYVLASPQSPMRALLVSMARQLALAGPGSVIDERYRGLRELAGNGPGAPIDQVLRSLNDMQQQLAKAAAASAGIATLAGQADPSVALRAEALRQPEPLARWLTTLAAGGGALRNGGRP